MPYRRLLLLSLVAVCAIVLQPVLPAAAQARTGMSDGEQPADPTAAPAATDAVTMISEVIRLTNIERANVGCPALVENPALDQAAQVHTDDMVAHDMLSHTGSDGSLPWDRMHAAGYNFRAAAENIAVDFMTPDEVVQGWMASTAGHRENILNCDLQEIGVGYGVEHIGIDVPFWTQVFGSQA